jgi:hypothetical protein
VDMWPCVSASHGVIKAVSEALRSPSGDRAPTPSVRHLSTVAHCVLMAYQPAQSDALISACPEASRRNVL